MPLHLDAKRVFTQRSERVKGLDIHPTEPWLLSNLYSGSLVIWNIADGTMVKSFEVCDLPVRASKFVPRKQWAVAGSDDMLIRVFNYNTMDKVHTFEAHTDYIRSIAVHPAAPYLLTCSDDMLIKLWDWDRGFQCVQVFEGHSHYVMQVAFNPKDSNTFASASLDRTVKVWSIGSPIPNYTLEGHEKGVNCLEYMSGGDRPYLISGADDRTVRIWDYQTKACVHVLTGHAHNVSAVGFHPELPLIISGSEDGSVRLWHSTTYRLEQTFSHGMERAWAIATQKGSNKIALGYDEGAVVVQVGREEPVASMDPSGKVVWARHADVQAANIKSLGDGAALADGERLPLAVKDLGSSDNYPASLQHSPNGRFVAVCGDGEYVIYTALAWRNRHFGTATDFCWSSDPTEFAVRDGTTLHVLRGFKEASSVRLPFAPEQMHGGHLIGVRSKDFVCFYDWAEQRLIRRIDVECRDVLWSESGEYVAILADSSFYILRYDAAAVADRLATGEPINDEDGLEEAFDVLHEVQGSVRSGAWVGDCFVYTNAAWRLAYCVGGEVTTMAHLDRPMYILGYLAQQSRVFLIDREHAIVSYELPLAVIEFKTLVLRGDEAGAEQALKGVPAGQMDNIARFLEARGMPERALEVATDQSYRFDLAVQLGRLADAMLIAQADDSETKWQQLGEMAMQAGELSVAGDCLERARDLPGLLMLYTSLGNREGLESLAAMASDAGSSNIAFVCLLLLGRTGECADLLAASGRRPEAAFFARTYCPSRVPGVMAAWREDLSTVNARAAAALADPGEAPELFQGWEESLAAEKLAEKIAARRDPAGAYAVAREALSVDLVERMRQMVEAGGSPEDAAPEPAPAPAPAPAAPPKAPEAPSTQPVAPVPAPPPPQEPVQPAPGASSASEGVAVVPVPAPTPPKVESPAAAPPPPAGAKSAEKSKGEEDLLGLDDDLAGLEVGDGDDLDDLEGDDLDDEWGLDDGQDD
ncbi:unnamed protein product [Pedinophyceae sp. YPF-701]|nr:unnamed protein product [Pedinophyceae sp. YPF-701]